MFSSSCGFQILQKSRAKYGIRVQSRTGDGKFLDHPFAYNLRMGENPYSTPTSRRHRGSRLLILLILGLMLLASLAVCWAWYEYVAYLKSLPLTPMPVPTPPGV